MTTYPTNCRTCGQELDTTDVAFKLNEKVAWYSLDSKPVGSFSSYGTRVKLVAANCYTTEEMGREDQEIWMVVEYEGKYYKKFGTADSYGERSWNGYVREVVPTEKTVTVYEF